MEWQELTRASIKECLPMFEKVVLLEVVSPFEFASLARK